MDPRSDEELACAAVAGDLDALNSLLRRCEPHLRRALRIDAPWRAVLEIDDILQVTYAEAFEHIGRFSYGGPGSFQAWLTRIARNNYLDAVRALTREKRPDPRRRVHADGSAAGRLVERLPGAGGTPSQHAARAESGIRLEEAIALLPDAYARVVRLCDLEGLAVRDAAESLGCTPGAVHMRLARAHERLQRILGTPSKYLST